MSRITFIGGGNMARSLIGGLIGAGTDPGSVHAAAPSQATRDGLAEEFGIRTHADNTAAIADAECVVLAVKPHILPAVCAELAAPLARTQPLLVSVAAGIRTDQIERWLGQPHPIVRVMPNTPALIGAGANGLFANAHVDPAQREQAQAVVAASGICEWVADETLIDTVTGISGSAPAYFFAVVEALEDAAVARGLERQAARHLAAQTCLGAGRMLMESGEAPAELRRRVTSPHGTTEAALNSLRDDDLHGIIEHAVEAARRRGGELAAENDPA